MMRKLLLISLCGLIHNSASSRIRFTQPFHEPVFRHDHHIHTEPVFKREHFYSREPITPQEQLLPPQNVLRNEPIYGNEAILPPLQPQQTVIPNEEFLPNEQIMQNEPILRNEHFIRADPILRREPIIRGEPLFRRGSFLRNEPIIRNERIYHQPTPILREGGIFRNEPNSYTFMVSQCPCQEQQNFGQAQDAFIPLPQPVQKQPIVSHRLIYPQPIIKPQTYQPIATFPRLQRFLRKGFRPMPENLQLQPQSMLNSQEMNSYNNEPVPFSNSYQSQPPQQENTSEPSQTNPVTSRNVPQMPNPLTLAQMSSIC